MMLKAYREGQFHFIRAREFAAIKADSKMVMGITPDGREWLLPDGLTLKALETLVLGLIRINRGVLVKCSCVTGVFRTRCGSSYTYTVETPVGDYRLARRNCAKSIIELVEQNTKKGLRTHTPTMESPE
jgi:hypothetical protein